MRRAFRPGAGPIVKRNPSGPWAEKDAATSISREIWRCCGGETPPPNDRYFGSVAATAQGLTAHRTVTEGRIVPSDVKCNVMVACERNRSLSDKTVPLILVIYQLFTDGIHYGIHNVFS